MLVYEIREIWGTYRNEPALVIKGIKKGIVDERKKEVSRGSVKLI